MLFRSLYPSDTISHTDFFVHRSTLSRYSNIIRLLDGECPRSNELMFTHYFRLLPGPLIPPTPDSTLPDLPRTPPTSKAHLDWLSHKVVRSTRHVHTTLQSLMSPMDYASLFDSPSSPLSTSLFDLFSSCVPLPDHTLLATSRTITELFQRNCTLSLTEYLQLLFPYFHDGAWHLLVINVGSHTLLHYSPSSSRPHIAQIRLLLAAFCQLSSVSSGSYRLFVINSPITSPNLSGVQVLYTIYSVMYRWPPSPLSPLDTYAAFRSQLIWSLYTSSFQTYDGGHEDATHLTPTSYYFRLDGLDVSLLTVPSVHTAAVLDSQTFSTHDRSRSLGQSSSSSLTPTPTFSSDQQCALFHSPHRCCVVCGHRPVTSPNPSQRAFAQSYHDYCLMLDSQHTTDYNRDLMLRSDMCICTYNINTITHNKALYLTWLIRHYRIDVLIVIDTRSDAQTSKYYKSILQHYHPGSAVLVSPSARPGQRAAQRVGGHFIFISPHWSGSLSPYISDYTNLGVLSSVTITLARARSMSPRSIYLSLLNSLLPTRSVKNLPIGFLLMVSTNLLKTTCSIDWRTLLRNIRMINTFLVVTSTPCGRRSRYLHGRPHGISRIRSTTTPTRSTRCLAHPFTPMKHLLVAR